MPVNFPWLFLGERSEVLKPSFQMQACCPLPLFRNLGPKVMSSLANKSPGGVMLNESVEMVITFPPPATDVRYLPFQISLVRCHKRSKLFKSSFHASDSTAAHSSVQDRRCSLGKTCEWVNLRWPCLLFKMILRLYGFTKPTQPGFTDSVILNNLPRDRRFHPACLDATRLRKLIYA